MTGRLAKAETVQGLIERLVNEPGCPGWIGREPSVIHILRPGRHGLAVGAWRWALHAIEGVNELGSCDTLYDVLRAPRLSFYAGVSGPEVIAGE